MVWLRANFIKSVVLGDDHVGKTSMLMSYATNRFPSQHVPTVFDNYAGKILISVFIASRGFFFHAIRFFFASLGIFKLVITITQLELCW